LRGARNRWAHATDANEAWFNANNTHRCVSGILDALLTLHALSWARELNVGA
jgi:hypothetical protein